MEQGKDSKREEKLLAAYAALGAIVKMYEDKVTDETLPLYSLVVAVTDMLGDAVTNAEYLS